MATRPTLHRAIAKTKNTASDYNDNFDMMMDFIDDSIDEAKDYVDDFMPSVTGQSGKFLTNDGTGANWVSIAGTIFYSASSTAPSGWLICDGSAVSRTTYAALYSAIGDTYGEGDGSTTFNLPDLIDKFPQGNTTVGTEKEAGLPNITGDARFCAWASTGATGALSQTQYNYGFDQGGASGGIAVYNSSLMKFNASDSSSVYGNSETVQPPALTLLPIIKY